MSLDARFVIASDLQSLYRDKDTGLPLSNGVIYFWKDQARSEPKDVYKLSGSPPNYSYTNIGSEVTLTASGTFSDNENPANDIIPYYFPYEGDPSSSDGTVELYYVEVYSEGGKDTGVLQFTREAWPNIAASEGDAQNVQNYIPNGQFKIHSDVEVDPSDLTAVPGQISQAITNLAQGGWTFERPDMSAATDIVLFQPFGGYVANPSASPTFAVNVETSVPSAGDAFKDLRIEFNDVNKFASDTEEYTCAFSGQSNSGSVNVALILIKNYGAGGDTQEEIALGNFIVTNSFSVIQKSGFVFGDNSGKVITDGNFLQLALRFPTGSLFNVLLTDFILTPGNVAVTEFPQTTDREFAYQAITPDIPDYRNMDLYLVQRLGPQGLIYDRSEIGEVIEESNISVYVDSLHPDTNKMLANGAQYETAAYSPLGVPFARLQAKYWNDTFQVPIYGTGPQYFLGVIDGSIDGQVAVSNNSPGVVSAASDGTVATGFTFQTVHIGGAAAFACQAWHVEGVGFIIQNTQNGAVTATNAGTSGYSVTQLQKGNSVLPEITLISTSASTAAGTYFTFDVSFSGMDQGYYVWFQVGGVGVDPAVGGRAGILINLTPGDYPDSVAKKIPLSLNQNSELSAVTVTAGSAVVAGSYFNLFATGDEYYVWYTKDGAGTDPKPGGKKPIKVSVLTADTNVQVASKTQVAINMKYFAAPDFRGCFLRGLGAVTGWPFDDQTRYSFIDGINGDVLGTFQLDSLKSHFHSATIPGFISSQAGGGATIDVANATQSIQTDSTGAYEVRPFNKNVNLAIRY